MFKRKKNKIENINYKLRTLNYCSIVCFPLSLIYARKEKVVRKTVNVELCGLLYKRLIYEEKFTVVNLCLKKFE
jgi:hypothetical protein